MTNDIGGDKYYYSVYRKIWPIIDGVERNERD